MLQQQRPATNEGLDANSRSRISVVFQQTSTEVARSQENSQGRANSQPNSNYKHSNSQIPSQSTAPLHAVVQLKPRKTVALPQPRAQPRTQKQQIKGFLKSALNRP